MTLLAALPDGDLLIAAIVLLAPISLAIDFALYLLRTRAGPDER